MSIGDGVAGVCAAVAEVVRRIRESGEVRRRKEGVRIMYGGSAGPGLFERL